MCLPKQMNSQAIGKERDEENTDDFAVVAPKCDLKHS